MCTAAAPKLGRPALGPDPGLRSVGSERTTHGDFLLLAPRRRRPTPRCLLGPRPTLAPATASHQPVDAASDGAVLVPLRQLEPLPTRPQGQPPRCQQTRCRHDCCAHSAGPGGGDFNTRWRTLAASARASSSAAPPRVESARRCVRCTNPARQARQNWRHAEQERRYGESIEEEDQGVPLLLPHLPVWQFSPSHPCPSCLPSSGRCLPCPIPCLPQLQKENSKMKTENAKPPNNK